MNNFSMSYSLQFQTIHGKEKNVNINFMLDINNDTRYIETMGTKDAVRTGINLTAEDRQIIRKLKRQLEPIHGKLTVTGVIRATLRLAVR